MARGRVQLTDDCFGQGDEVRRGVSTPTSPRHCGVPSIASDTPEGDGLIQYMPKGYATGMRDLAVEILIHIFSHVVPTCRRHIRVTHVCHLWRALFLDIPEFWADMLAVPHFFTKKDSTQAVELWHAFLDRTTSALPLKLQLTERNLELVYRIPPQHLSRVHTLCVRCKTGDQELRDIGCLDSRLSSLEVLICTGDGRLLQACASYSRLRHLEVGARSFPAMSGIAGPSLSALVIHSGALSPSEFVTTLSRFPALEVLELRRITTVGGRLSTENTVRLTRLREWVMSNSGSSRQESRSDDWILYMLHHIACPPTATVTISTAHDYASTLLRGVTTFPHFIPDSRAQFVFRLAYDVNLDTPVLRIAASVYKEKSPRWQMSTTDVAWRVGSGHLWDARPATVACSVMLTFLKYPMQGITTLQLRLSRRAQPATHAHWKVFLEAFSSVQSLSIRARSCKGLLRALRRYAIPRTLEKLDITCCNGTGIYRNLTTTVEVCVDEGLPLRYLAFYHRESHAQVPTELLERICSVIPEVVIGTF